MKRKTTSLKGWRSISSCQQGPCHYLPYFPAIKWTKDVEDAVTLVPNHIPSLHCDSSGRNMDTLEKGTRPANRGLHSSRRRSGAHSDAMLYLRLMIR